VCILSTEEKLRSANEACVAIAVLTGPCRVPDFDPYLARGSFPSANTVTV